MWGRHLRNLSCDYSAHGFRNILHVDGLQPCSAITEQRIYRQQPYQSYNGR